MGHQPKGSMCAVCTRRDKDCSALPFSTMPIMRKLTDGTAIVKCSDFEKRK